MRECLICGSQEVDTAHIQTRGSGGGDDPGNTMDLCRAHHTEQHKIGIVTFAEKYKTARDYMAGHDWIIVDLFGQKKLRRGPCFQASISSPADSHAKTSRPLAAVLDWRESEVDFFSKSSDWSMNYDRNSSSWKMSQLSLLADLEPSSANLPNSGMTVGGRLFQPQNLAPVTSEKGGSCSLPTPLANDGEKRGNFEITNPRNGLPAAVQNLPTPTATPYGYNQSCSPNAKRRMGLDSMAARGVLPTPLARDAKGPMGKKALERRNSPNLPDSVNGPLNPQFVEEIMGYRIDATALDALGTQWFRSKRASRSSASQELEASI